MELLGVPRGRCDCPEITRSNEMSAFWAFLRRSKARWLAIERGTEPVPVRCAMVIGNEAADCDSCVSALVWAFHRSVADAEVPVFPIVSCASEDLVLRREFTLLLSKSLELAGAGGDIDPTADQSPLICVDSVARAMPWLEPMSREGRLALTLTDHNQLCAELSPLGQGVVEIVDHHFDVGAYPGVVGERRAIAYDATEGRGIGSACTLVAEAVLNGSAARGAAVDDDAVGRRGPSVDVAILLLGTILLDTINLSVAAGKATPRDAAAVESLATVLGSTTPGGDFDARQVCLLQDRPSYVISPSCLLQCVIHSAPECPRRPVVVACPVGCTGAGPRLQGLHCDAGCSC